MKIIIFTTYKNTVNGEAGFQMPILPTRNRREGKSLHSEDMKRLAELY